MTNVEALTDAIHLLELVRDDLSATGRWRRRWQLDDTITHLDQLRFELGLLQTERLPIKR